jgi:cytochrome oxidase Cu insertion factor (SCO1/SenC/PrrC family)
MNRLATCALLALSLPACQKSGAGDKGKAQAQAARPAPRAPLPVGTPAPDFSATAHDGTAIQMSALRGSPVVLYFYPKDETPG